MDHRLVKLKFLVTALIYAKHLIAYPVRHSTVKDNLVLPTVDNKIIVNHGRVRACV